MIKFSNSFLILSLSPPSAKLLADRVFSLLHWRREQPRAPISYHLRDKSQNCNTRLKSDQPERGSQLSSHHANTWWSHDGQEDVSLWWSLGNEDKIHIDNTLNLYVNNLQIESQLWEYENVWTSWQSNEYNYRVLSVQVIREAERVIYSGMFIIFQSSHFSPS